jgi:hypothetical protein
LLERPLPGLGGVPQRAVSRGLLLPGGFERGRFCFCCQRCFNSGSSPRRSLDSGGVFGLCSRCGALGVGARGGELLPRQAFALRGRDRGGSPRVRVGVSYASLGRRSLGRVARLDACVVVECRTVAAAGYAPQSLGRCRRCRR